MIGSMGSNVRQGAGTCHVTNFVSDHDSHNLSASTVFSVYKNLRRTLGYRSCHVEPGVFCWVASNIVSSDHLTLQNSKRRAATIEFKPL